MPYLNLWTLAWNHRWLKGQTPSYWDANQFFPHQKHSRIQSRNWVPLCLRFLLYFSAAIPFSHITSPYSCFFSVPEWPFMPFVGGFLVGKRNPPNYPMHRIITAGILYAFTPYMFRELGVLQLLATLFPPLCLLGLHRFFIKSPGQLHFFFCRVSRLLVYMCILRVILSVFVVCFPFFFWHRDLLRWRHLLRELITVAILIGGLLPLAYGMQSQKRHCRLIGLKRLYKCCLQHLQDTFSPLQVAYFMSKF